MAPKEGNSIVKHGVLDERLNVHGVKGLKVSDLSICPDNVGCNTYSTYVASPVAPCVAPANIFKCLAHRREMRHVDRRGLGLQRPRLGHARSRVPRSERDDRLVSPVIESNRNGQGEVCRSGRNVIEDSVFYVYTTVMNKESALSIVFLMLCVCCVFSSYFLSSCHVWKNGC